MNQQSFICHFLLAPQFRIWRYLALVFFFVIVSLNQAFVGYKDIIPLIGNKVYWIVAGTTAVYIVSVYLVLKIIERCLTSSKYMLFVCSILLLAAFYTAIASSVLVLYEEEYVFFSESAIIDNLSAFVVYILCISGVIIPVFLRNWILSNQQLSELKVKQQLSQVEQLKAQINPASFFKILNKSGTLVKPEPDKASVMLMRLSQLLRYQLYDCNRAAVFLSSEISFLHNFLELEKLYSSTFNYTISTNGNINGLSIPPSILLPYIQGVINALDREEDCREMDILVHHSQATICVSLTAWGVASGTLLQKELLTVRERLNTLYKNHYELNVTRGKPTGETEVTLLLHKS